MTEEKKPEDEGNGPHVVGEKHPGRRSSEKMDGLFKDLYRSLRFILASFQVQSHHQPSSSQIVASWKELGSRDKVRPR